MKAIITPTSQVLNGTEKCVIVKACAGAGKTTLITAKVQKILEDDPDVTVRVLTFNRDAAADDKRRIKCTVQTFIRGGQQATALPSLLKAFGYPQTNAFRKPLI